MYTGMLATFVWTFEGICKAVGLVLTIIFVLFCLVMALIEEKRNKRKRKY